MSHAETDGLENFSFHSSSRYSVVEEVGRGGMGIILLSNKNTGGVLDQVVLKSLRTIEPEEEEKLRQEASIATMLRHENIVKTYGLETVPFSQLPPEFLSNLDIRLEQRESFLGRITGMAKEEKHLLLLIMDYIKGTDFFSLLVDHLKNDCLFPIPLAAFVISRIAIALSYAHTYIIHRDISPENILISEQGVCKLTDFGVAVISSQQPEDWAGKLMYMAPEQLRNDDIDERADIFALGLVAYQAITGITLLYARPSLPFEEQVKIIYSQMQNNLVPPHLVRKDVPVALSRIIGKMLSFAPEYRYQRASAVVNDLEKEYLYASGYGPTNNSLAAYIDIFNSNFQEYNEEQLQQLSFLKDQEGRIGLKRPLNIEGYTRTGQRLLAERKGSLVVKRMREIYKKKQQKRPALKPKGEKIPVVKVKYLSNLVETFSLKDESVTIGRSGNNIVVLPSSVVSSQHARCYLNNGIPTVVDNNSHNGTFCNNKKITSMSLQEGDRIQIGHTTIYFLWEKRPESCLNIFSLNEDIDVQKLGSQDFTLQFHPDDSTLITLPDIIEEVLHQTHLGGRKRSVLPAALYEAVRILRGEGNFPMKLRIMRFRGKLGFLCQPSPKSYGYEAFLSSIFQRIEKDIGREIDDALELEPKEIALSLILKVFERIEMVRFRKEICFYQTLV